jgi:hypothetical protein
MTDQLSDIFTKALGLDKLWNFFVSFGLQSLDVLSLTGRTINIKHMIGIHYDIRSKTNCKSTPKKTTQYASSHEPNQLGLYKEERVKKERWANKTRYQFDIQKGDQHCRADHWVNLSNISRNDSIFKLIWPS